MSNSNAGGRMRTYEATVGCHIERAIRDAIRDANEHREPVLMRFNDREVVVQPGNDPVVVLMEWRAEGDRQHAVWLASPEGQASVARRAEAERVASKAAAAGILPFTLANPEGWASCVAANTDDYGAAAIRFAARWANMMEAKMASGQRLEDIADDASRDADLEGITGYMYGAAVGILAKVWTHGEALRRWHNLRTQLGNEGERANESGGTLNPALLSVGSSSPAAT